MPRAKIDIALKEAKALRGDPPRGQDNWTKVETGFEFAIDLVKYIRQEYGGMLINSFTFTQISKFVFNQKTISVSALLHIPKVILKTKIMPMI
jgi:5,10-methylenetetrahydrofolate reductase